jgi:uncharacterized protein (DUF302 family)
LKKIIFGFFFILSTSLQADNGLIQLKSASTVDETVKHLVTILKRKGMTIFDIIDHQKGAKGVGIVLPPTTVVIFGNPKIGSLLMQCGATMAIDLPQKALIWQDKHQQTWLAYNAPHYLADRHQLKQCNTVIKKIKGALAKFAQLATKKTAP